MSQSIATANLSNLADLAVTVRRATDVDRTALRRLAALDSRRPLTGPVLVAEVDGVVVAARSLATGDVAADPFRHTADLVTLLHERARHLLQDDEARAEPTLLGWVGASLGLRRVRSG